MSRPRRIPSTVYPAGAELRYFQALRKEIVDWFTDLTADLQSIYQRRMDARPDEILGQISEQLQQIKSTAARAESRLKRQEAMSAVNAARARWQQAEANLMRAVGETADIVNRLSDRSVQNQIDAALTNRKLRVQNGQPMFGELQAEIDTFTQNNALLIKDIGEKAAREISYIVQNAVGEGQKWGSIATLIKKRLDVTEARAALIAQNQTARLETQLSTIRAESSGAVAFEWQRTASANPRSSHAIKAGNVYPIDSSPKPREEPNCKCGMRFVWPGDELLNSTQPREMPDKAEVEKHIAPTLSLLAELSEIENQGIDSPELRRKAYSASMQHVENSIDIPGYGLDKVKKVIVSQSGPLLTAQNFSNQLKVVSGHVFELASDYKLYLRDDIDLISFSEDGIPNGDGDALFRKNGVVYFTEMKNRTAKAGKLIKQAETYGKKVIKGAVERGVVGESEEKVMLFLYPLGEVSSNSLHRIKLATAPYGFSTVKFIKDLDEIKDL